MVKPTRIERPVRPAASQKLLDLKLGYALLCDRRVPLRCKVGAFVIGIAVLGILLSFEFPVEEILAMVIPFLGMVGDVGLDGVEAIIVPIGVACLLMPYVAPSAVVDQVRRERSPVVDDSEGPIIDV